MNARTTELLILALTGFAVPLALIWLTPGKLTGAWDAAAMSGWTAGAIFGVLTVLGLFGFPTYDHEEDEDDEDDTPHWNHIRLWQLCLGLGTPLLLYADAVTGDTGDFAVMANSIAFWPGLAANGWVALVILWRLLVAFFGEDEEPQLTTHGSARFATDTEIEKSGLLSNNGIYLGQYPELTNEGLWYSIAATAT